MTSVVQQALAILDAGRAPPMAPRSVKAKAAPAVAGPHPRGMHRDRKLLDLCHEAPCMLQIAGVCGAGGHASVPCHSNRQRHGRGRNHKSHDCFAVPGCPPCHQWLDEGKSDRETKDVMFERARDRWEVYRWRAGLVQVSSKADAARASSGAL